ncbi:hypothetical protein [Loigolactobacillus backii]|uniref:Uncharacterized protein n=1 Tax=Loigolactobacillus backii TaxID=375175 RepID=A0A192H1K9_9LACO|nr:hypothetical protein [Loigolactobacillus backii]ANK62122.1 hypothetical protein AYR53_04660 [Loigolactobacillus backii]ANK68683.1 hypothetical protein AYR56_00060 [Loigolactobacillus backii]MDA5386686.1 hypothetical protein [Loigolactobacillus backii]MDA5389211.1 hypothetical protein [Loigolactobacillus backii]
MDDWIKTNVEIKVTGPDIANEATRVFHDCKEEVTSEQLIGLGKVVESLSGHRANAGVIVNYRRQDFLGDEN